MLISRRQFCSSVAAAASLSLCELRLNAAHDARPLRVIAYNVYACKGWPADRPAAKQAVAKNEMAARLAAELAKYHPDIVNFSESPAESIAKEVAQSLGMQHVRFPSGGNWPGTLLSRFPITDSKNVPLVEGERPRELFTRHWGRGTVTLPNGEALIVHSAHLFPGPDPKIRLKEIPLMIEAMRPDLDAGRSLLLMGDLNHAPDTQEYRLWMEAGLVDSFAKVGQGNGDTIKADDPQHRIDYVMAAGPIADRIAASRPLFEGAFRLDTTKPEAFALSDHLPQFAEFRAR